MKMLDLEKLIWNDLKIAFRRIKRQKGYSFISITGLAIGLACCFLIVIYILTEISFDRYHVQSNRIYRLGISGKIGENSFTMPVSNTPAAPALVKDYPEVLNAVRFRPTSPRTLVKHGDRQYFEGGIFYADNSVFEVFTFPLTKGDPKTALQAPYSLVISETIAEKYFRDENPIGRTLRLNNKEDLTVTGVIKNVPRNSHFTFNMLISFETLYAQNPRAQERWLGFPNYTYLLFSKDAHPREFEGKLAIFVENHMSQPLKAVSGELNYFLQPLTRIHLHSHLENEISGNSSILYVYVFSALAIFILFLACINFMNLSTARSAARAKEIGMRKVVGARRKELIRQFLSETLVYSSISFLIAAVLVEMSLPLLTSVSGVDLRIDPSQLPWLIPSLFGLAVFVGVAAGSYPGFFLSSYRPAEVLKGNPRAGAAGSRFRSVLVVFQFVISISLIIGTGMIIKQLRFMKERDPGFIKENIIVVRVMPQRVQQTFPVIKTRLEQIPGVRSVAASSTVPGIDPNVGAFVPEGFQDNETQMMDAINVNSDFIPTMGIQIVSGRNFSPEFGTDRQDAVIINQAAARKFGWDDPVGKTIKVYLNEQKRMETKTVIGVVHDFHLASFYKTIAPLYISNLPEGLGGLIIKINPENTQETLGTLQKIWPEIDPDRPFDYFFLKDFFDSQYQSEERLRGVIGSFAGFSLFIACLGLFGMASFAIEQRTKEIGVRKILGASVTKMALMLAKESAKWVLIANLIAWPITYFAAINWLRNFAYRTGIEIWIFVLSAILALFIATLTVSYQSIKAGLANPVESLRHE
jgi:putative ABC transport system permease protein